MNEKIIYLISDSTGETLHAIIKAITVQFSTISFTERIYSSVRSETQILEILQHVKDHQGLLVYTMVNKDLNLFIMQQAKAFSLTAIDILSPLIKQFSSYYNEEGIARLPGMQHALNKEYFERIEALDFAYQHDDGQQLEKIDMADIIIIGVSRTSKTPTSIYLANKGIKVANIPYIYPGYFPDNLPSCNNFIIALYKNAEELLQIRKERLHTLHEYSHTNYVDLDSIDEEIENLKKLCRKNKWPILDITHRSIEETAVTIIQKWEKWKLYNNV